MIHLYYQTLDGLSYTIKAKSVAGAKKSIEHRLGTDFELGSFYAISADGVVKVSVSGDESIRSLYPEKIV